MSSNVTQFVDKDILPLTATISNGGTLSSTVFLDGCTAAKFLLPAAFTSGSITINGSIDGGTTFGPLYDSTDTLISYSGAAGKLCTLLPSYLIGCNALQFVVAAQGAARTILVKPVL